MNVSTLKSIITMNLFNIPGWRTSRKIVVIQSDDWGSVRMPSKEVYRQLLKAGIRVDKCPYCRYDSLATEEDLSMFFETLTSFKDINGSYPVITANCVVANPNFEKIKAANFQKYYYEPFTETLKKKSNTVNSFNLWQQGMDAGFFFPQFHGREHLNVPRWMNALRSGLPETKFAFDHNLFGISTTITSEKRESFLESLDFASKTEENNIKNLVLDGLKLFKKMFGYSSQSFVAPNYVWSPSIENALSENGIRYIQSQRVQKVPIFNSPRKKKIYHYTGQQTRNNQFYVLRNCHFEPSFSENRDAVSDCLAQIESSFKWSKPAVIASHRVNYIGSIEQSNRDRNLRKLRQLLAKIQEKWPMTEFISTVQLGEIMSVKD